MTERQPMGVHIALSAAQLEHAGVPIDMTEDELADCIDKALLEDDTALQQEIQQWIEDRENDEPWNAGALTGYLVSRETRDQLVAFIEELVAEDALSLGVIKEAVLTELKDATAVCLDARHQHSDNNPPDERCFNE
ncbi:MAG TPA: hypothetical protein VFB99_08100 [Vicinamibacterales bacterium]|nr:hypothetical protein [Vicinamibacterales bacterium]